MPVSAEHRMLPNPSVKASAKSATRRLPKGASLFSMGRRRATLLVSPYLKR